MKNALSEFREKYFQSLLNSQSDQAKIVVEEIIQQGWSMHDIYSQVLAPSQFRIGEMWIRGQINVAQEHFATEITFQQMERVKAAFTPSSKTSNLAIVAAVEGDHHAIGAKMVADFFYIKGWNVDFLGSNIPKDDLIEFIADRKPHILALSVTLRKNLLQVNEIVQTIKSVFPTVKIMLGGRAFSQISDEVESSDADIIAIDAMEGVNRALKLVGIKQEINSLEEYLKKLGNQIQQLRKKKNWSQQQLAEQAHLERTYISTVERGKQNLTVGALIKIANALETSLEDIISARDNWEKRIR